MRRLCCVACAALLGITACSTVPAPISERGAVPSGAGWPTQPDAEPASPSAPFDPAASTSLSTSHGRPLGTSHDKPLRTSKGGYYTVRRGDTLAVVAFLCGCDMRELAAWNHIAPPYVIQVGQRMRLSPPLGEPQARPPATVPRDDTAPAAPLEAGAWQWPAPGRVLRGFDADANARKGLDLGGREGEPVKAAAGGRVVYAGNGLLGYGYLVIIQHSERLLSAYGYNRKLAVNEGQMVHAGQTIAEMGSDSNARPMLHFEVRRDGRPVDPRGYLPARR